MVKNQTESIPRQVDEKAGVPEDEEKKPGALKEVWIRISILKEEVLFPLHSLVLVT